jgi:hypothetical protein
VHHLLHPTTAAACISDHAPSQAIYTVSQTQQKIKVAPTHLHSNIFQPQAFCFASAPHSKHHLLITAYLLTPTAAITAAAAAAISLWFVSIIFLLYWCQLHCEGAVLLFDDLCWVAVHVHVDASVGGALLHEELAHLHPAGAAHACGLLFAVNHAYTSVGGALFYEEPAHLQQQQQQQHSTCMWVQFTSMWMPAVAVHCILKNWHTCTQQQQQQRQQHRAPCTDDNCLSIPVAFHAQPWVVEIVSNLVSNIQGQCPVSNTEQNAPRTPARLCCC